MGHLLSYVNFFPLPNRARIWFAPAMSLTNEEIEKQFLQLADALEKMSEVMATVTKEHDARIQALSERIDALGQTRDGGAE
jgi:hypothetical protein